MTTLRHITVHVVITRRAAPEPMTVLLPPDLLAALLLTHDCPGAPGGPGEAGTPTARDTQGTRPPTLRPLTESEVHRFLNDLG
ncbi:hypothetical protein ACFVIM_34965 [Streptomyces sp. NPDC057638]|uniref:hypothetical protein n=1 Tax=Streptomyces sp. NPDC057638 TaxID=3346190 RepID=UPI0036A22753